MVTDRTITGISMFSSAGIAETYLSKLNIHIALANEILKERAEYYTHFYPDTDMLVGDIMDGKILDEYVARARKLNPSFLLATPPCQGMSSLGKKEYAEDVRNYLIFAVLKVIDSLDLDVVVIENVPKFLKLYFPYENDYLGIVDILQRRYGGRYNIRYDIFNAKDYGVAQSRPRAIIILYKNNYSWSYPAPEHEITLRQAIGHLPSLNNGEHSDIKYHYALNHSAMQVECMSHTDEGCSAMTNEVYYPKRADGKKVSGFHNTYKRMRWDAPCPARATNNGLISGHNNVHPGRKLADGTVSDARVLSMLELLIVSSLPQDWNLPCGYNEYLVRTLIGEAIPPMLLYRILSTLKRKDMKRVNKSDKWTMMKYIKSFDLMVKYAYVARKHGALFDDRSLDNINELMMDSGTYVPRYDVPSRDTTIFKMCQVAYSMIAYKAGRGQGQRLVFSPLGNKLIDTYMDSELDNKTKIDRVAKIYMSMLFSLPFNHPFNQMSSSFNIYPFRLIFKLLRDPRLDGRLYCDEMFYYVMWCKTIDNDDYESLVENILGLRRMNPVDKLEMFKRTLPEEDTLANALHEAVYAFGQLAGGGIVTHYDVKRKNYIGPLHHGGFGRGMLPDYISEEELASKKRSTRNYRLNYIELRPEIEEFADKMLAAYSYDEKPHDLYKLLGTSDYIMHLYNFYPEELREELDPKQKALVSYIMQLTDKIKQYSRNQEKGDSHRFEQVLSDAFNEFIDVEAEWIAKSGTTDVECIYLTNNEKFDLEAKSTETKLQNVVTPRLQRHRELIGSSYTIVVTPYFVKGALEDIKGTRNLLLTANSLSNFLYQSVIHCGTNISYEPIYNIVKGSMGQDISRSLNEWVEMNYGIGRVAGARGQKP